MSSEGACALLTGPEVGSGLSPRKGTPHLLTVSGSELEASNVGVERLKEFLMIPSFYRMDIQGPGRKGLFIKEKSRPGGRGGGSVGDQDWPWKLGPPILPGFHIFWDIKGPQKVLACCLSFPESPRQPA